MSHRGRIPGMRQMRALYVLPPIPDDAPDELKNALAIRNACATEGRCPDCGVAGEVYRDTEYEGIYHYTFRHEPGCRCLTDGEAA